MLRLLLFLLLINYSCNSNNVEKEKMKRVIEQEIIVEYLGEDSLYRLEYQIDKSNGLKHGFFKEYDQNGLYIERHYEQDSMQGAEKTYYSGTNDLFSLYNCENNQYHGEFTFYHPNGKLKQKGNMIEGKIEGMLKTYYPDGTLKDELMHVDGVTKGIFNEYNQSGILVARGNYVTKGEFEELEDGLLELFADDGSAKTKMICKAGRCCTIWSIEDGTIKASNELCEQIISDYNKNKE